MQPLQSHNNTSCLAHYQGAVHIQELQTTWLLASVVFYAILGIIGTVGNVLVLSVFWLSRDKSLRTLVISLSIVDFLICAVIIPIDCHRVYSVYVNGPISDSVHVLDMIIVSVRNASFVVEMFLLVLIAVDRYYAIIRPTDDVISQRRIVIFVSLVTLLALALELSIALIHLLKEKDCELKINLSYAMHYFYATASLISMLLVGLLYARLMCLVQALELRRSQRRSTVTQRNFGGRDEDDEKSTIRMSRWKNNSTSTCKSNEASTVKTRTRQVAVMLAASSVLFYITILPTVLINLNLIPDSPLHRFYFLNCAANFFLYALFSPKFRMDVRKAARKMKSSIVNVVESCAQTSLLAETANDLAKRQKEANNTNGDVAIQAEGLLERNVTLV